MDTKRRFTPDYPSDLQIYEYQLSPAGGYFKRPEVQVFVRAKNLSLELEREPDNKNDRNAIKIFGCSRGVLLRKRHFLGYLPAEVAKKVVEGGFWNKVQARLRLVDAGDYVTVEFELLGPKGQRKAYLSE